MQYNKFIFFFLVLGTWGTSEAELQTVISNKMLRLLKTPVNSYLYWVTQYNLPQQHLFDCVVQEDAVHGLSNGLLAPEV